MKISELFGSMVFDDESMKKSLSEETYLEFKSCCYHDEPLSLETANIIANAMKDWAVEKGVTHFTHWFQPMTGITAEKHDSFISPTKNGEVMMEFSGKELIKGEPDASSFPSGGLRATFEARGYTAWDPTSYAFIKDGTLCIPTAFCSYNGYALDKKTPLLRSMEALNTQAKRLLCLFKKDIDKVYVTVGSEQEYFLIDTKIYEKRKDLFYTGRTLFGSSPPKGQELDDHYFGAIKPRVVAYMKELDEELWKLSILAKTKHNEAAPAQHELAPIFTTVNVACDQNQLTMEMMKKVAKKHGMTCLLHEKPFLGVNGSGKHNNWSMVTDNGINLFEPGNNPQDNALFLLMLSAFISSVDKHQDLLRICCASAGNDHRLGAAEAPPAIISIFLGDELTGILQAIADNRTYSKRAKCEVELGVHVLPKFSMDSTDRNRTSPLAFTGNKFEFRMPGSSFSIAGINLVLNTIIASELEIFAKKLEKYDDIHLGIKDIIAETIKAHSRIIFNGNNYSSQWVAEAKRRKLLNWATTSEALPHFSDKKNIALFESQKVLSKIEILSRQEILIANYCKLLNIEAMTTVYVASKHILPAVFTCKRRLSETALSVKSLGFEASAEVALVGKLDELSAIASQKIAVLLEVAENAHNAGETPRASKLYRKEVIPAMNEVRKVCDELEIYTAKKYWPFPTYGDILFSVN